MCKGEKDKRDAVTSEKIFKKGFVHSGKHQCNGNIFHLNDWLVVRHFVVMMMNSRKQVIADFA